MYVGALFLFTLQKLYNIEVSFSLIYLIQRFFYRIYEFMRHWYIGGFLKVVHRTLSFLEILDRRLALKITLRYLFRPLYQDYTVLGYILGFIFRSARVAIAGFVYLIVILIALAVYLAWAAFPAYLVYKIFNS